MCFALKTEAMGGRLLTERRKTLVTEV
ncbi:hypothetical protein A2U01_0082677, partial [Trifolium medium]|nr:hypothetical protein [Trifolium medium]